MRHLRLFAGLVLLAGCQAPGQAPVDASAYACPDGRLLRAGLGADQRRLYLSIDGRRHVLGRQDDGSYGNGYYRVRLDDLFLRLSLPGTLLPLHCHLAVPGDGADTQAR